MQKNITIASAGNKLRKCLVTFHVNIVYQGVPKNLSICREKLKKMNYKTLKIISCVQVQGMLVFILLLKILDHVNQSSVARK